MNEMMTNHEVVISVIDELREAFPEIFMKYNNYKREANNFYMFGHCASFADILSEIFKGYATQYSNGGHVITKIGEDFFDILGWANGEYLNPREGGKYKAWIDAPLEYDFCDLTSKDDHDYELRMELIQIGKRKLQELTSSFIQEEKQKNTI